MSVLLLGGCHGKGDAGAAKVEEAPVPIVKVEVQPVVSVSLDDTVESLGITQPMLNRTARITTAIEGRVAAILPRSPRTDSAARTDVDSSAAPAVLGQLVTQRQVIVRLEDGLAQANVAKTEALLAEAEATASAQNVPRPQQVEAAKSAAASAKTALKAAEDQLKRLSEIPTLVGPAQLADARTAVEKAQSDQHAAEARLAEFSDLPASRKAAELQAKIKAAEADLRSAQTQLELTNIRSPIAGRLGKLSVFLGQSLPVGSPVAAVTDLSSIDVEASVPAKHIAAIKAGQPVTIWWGSEADGVKIQGRVAFVDHEIDPGAGSFIVHVTAENPDEQFRLGLHVHARIVVRRLENVLAVPRAAVIDESDTPHVFVAKKEGDKLAPHRVNVKTGVTSGDLIQIDGEGLKAGDQVVTKGNYFLPDKAELEIASEKDEAGPGEIEKSKATASEAKSEDVKNLVK